MGNMAAKFGLTRKQKWAVLIIIAAAALGLLIFYLIKISPPPVKPAPIAQESTVAAGESDLLRDDDGDGLKNWEEAIWKTDPKNPDTDGDGAKDGDEAAVNNDPAVKGKGKLPESASGEVTTELARAIIDSGTFEAAVKGGSPQLPDNLINNIRDSFTAKGDIFIKSRIVGLKYNDANDPGAIKRYLNSVAGVYLENFQKLQKNDFEVFAEIVRQPQDMPDTKALDFQIKVAEGAANGIKNLEAPRSLKDIHEQNVKLHFRSLFELLAVKEVGKDPASALFAVQSHFLTKYQTSAFLHNDIKNLVSAKKIVFADDEIGRQMFNW